MNLEDTRNIKTFVRGKHANKTRTKSSIGKIRHKQSRFELAFHNHRPLNLQFLLYRDWISKKFSQGLPLKLNFASFGKANSNRKSIFQNIPSRKLKTEMKMWRSNYRFDRLKVPLVVYNQLESWRVNSLES